MAKSEFAGDKQFRLPKGKVEPYRLWFEFLKLAEKHPNIEIDQKHYAMWSDFRDLKFEDWWKSRWRELFSMKAATRVLDSVAEFEVAEADPTIVVVQVSLNDSKQRRIKDINDALAGLSVRGDDKSKAKTKPVYEISSKRKINFKTLRAMLKYLQLYQSNEFDIEAASLAYFKWARAWNEKVRSKKWKRPLVYEPPFLRKLTEEINDRRNYIRQHGSKPKSNTREYDDFRSQARRFLRKGEKILTNVAIGKFPGSF